MDKIFTDICLMVVPSALVWHIFFLFFYSDSRYQQYRLRKAIDSIDSYIDTHRDSTGGPEALNIIYKNKKFSVEVLHKEVNRVYSTYTVYINDAEACRYHRLKHGLSSSYHYEELNKRHRDEVEAIIYATNKVIKQQAKPKKVKNDGYTEYSYFN